MKTGRNIQRDIFLKSLREQMDKMSSSMRKGDLEEAAENYLREGCSTEEAAELLAIDGFDGDVAKSCLDKLAASHEVIDDSIPQWGFEVEDTYGRTITNSDLDITITAATEREALKKAEDILFSEPDSKPDGSVKVFRL